MLKILLLNYLFQLIVPMPVTETESDSLESVMFIWDAVESFTKLSVMSPNTIHMRGSTTPLAMDITVPEMISTMSTTSANLNYTHMKESAWKREQAEISICMLWWMLLIICWVGEF